MKINKNVVIGVVTLIVLAGIALLVANGPALWEALLRMHGMR